MKRTLLSFSLIIAGIILFAQEGNLKPIGSWTEYLPFQKGTTIDIHSNMLYCGTTTGLFTLNLSDNSISRYSTVNSLNEISVAKLKYSSTYGTLVVVYQNLNIDLIKGGQTINIPSIKDASLVNKSINQIFLKDQYAYLSMGFGIVKLDILRNEITETYQFADGGNAINVNSTYVDETKIYAACNDGIYTANLSSNLLDFNNWSLYNTNGKQKFIDLFEFNNELLAVYDQNNSDSIYVLENGSLILKSIISGSNFLDKSISGDRLLMASSAGVQIFDKQYQQLSQFAPFLNNLSDIVFDNSNVYLLNNFDPLLQFNYSGEKLAAIRPEGPFEENISDIEINEGILWAVPGGYDQSINNLYRPGRLYRYTNGSWTSFIDFNIPSLNGTYDLLSINSNPNNPNELYIGCWGIGLLEYKNDLPFNGYDHNNSILNDRLLRPDWVAIGETAYDADGNLWIVNSYTNTLLKARTPNGSWFEFDFSTIRSDDALESGPETAAIEIAITDAGLIWVALPFDNHILVLDHNNTISNPSDDKYLVLKQGEGIGNVPGIRGITMDLDNENQLWIGTTDGIAVQYNPDNIFDRSKAERDFERVLIDDGENVEILLGGTEVVDIETDGANRKWIATNGSGVYLLSPDGQEEILHFTTDNSPLFSNNILAIALDEKSGEVYMATANGLISYRSDVVAGEDNLSNIKIFPNPVREDYEGSIAIDGLMDRTRVKITDIEGRLVNELESKGGRALWNGRDLNGERVSTGVYLVFNSALTEKESLRTAIGKILFIN